MGPFFQYNYSLAKVALNFCCMAFNILVLVSLLLSISIIFGLMES